MLDEIGCVLCRFVCVRITSPVPGDGKPWGQAPPVNFVSQNKDLLLLNFKRSADHIQIWPWESWSQTLDLFGNLEIYVKLFWLFRLNIVVRVGFAVREAQIKIVYPFSTRGEKVVSRQIFWKLKNVFNFRHISCNVWLQSPQWDLCPTTGCDFWLTAIFHIIV